MSLERTIELTENWIMPTYTRLPVCFVRGQGARLWDSEGNEYLDFVAGISVLAVGHSHPEIVETIQDQAARITHTSNLYYIQQQAELARKLAELSFGGKCFFCNSGAEANEAAIKLARKWATSNRPDIEPARRKILTAYNSFHGRSITTITATGQMKYHHGFKPLDPGFDYFEFGSIEDLEKHITDSVIGIMVEPIQAEGGMNAPPDGFLCDLRQVCDDNECLLILDEVQTGMGRTGEWFGYMHERAEPDIMTLAKALGSGYPIGCCIAGSQIADEFSPGSHASTFGGSHMACAVALKTIGIIERDGLVENAARMGQVLSQVLGPQAHDAILRVRGRGLLAAVQFQPDAVNARELQDECLDRGLVVNAMGDDRVRIAPPLNITLEELERGAAIICEALDELT